MLNIALIGAGGIARTHAESLQDFPMARLAAVVDINEHAAKKIADPHNARAFNNLNAMLESDLEIDAAIICTPPNTHEELTLACVEDGLHVLCEKPFAPTSVMARRMLRAAQDAGVILTMASKFRYVPDISEARRILDTGILGEIILFENVFASRVDMTKRWNSDPTVSGGGVLIDNGAHSVDLLRFFLGPLAEVHAVEGKRVQTPAVEDTVRLFVRSLSGVMGSIDLSWTLNKETDAFVSIYGSQGTLHVGWKQSRYKLDNQADWKVFGNGYRKVDAFRNQLSNFCSAIIRNAPLLITWEDAVASVHVIEASYLSLRNCAWTNVEAADRRRKVRAVH